MAGEQVKAPATKKQDAVAQVKEGVVDVVMRNVNQFIVNGELILPPNYSVENAMKSAWLVLQQTVNKEGKPALEVCTKQSIANALLDMVVQGLNPGKKQVYFIVYGAQLNAQRSYFGSMAVAQMVNPAIFEFAYAVVYEGDVFKYGILHGKKTVQNHEQELENVDKKKIIAAYAIALDKTGEPLRTEIMTFDEILQAWKQSPTKPIDDQGNVKDFSTHGKFSADMAMKTVANKLCKAIINASSDNALLLERINRAEELADRSAVGIEVEENANKGPVIDITEEKKEVEPGPEKEKQATEEKKELETVKAPY